MVHAIDGYWKDDGEEFEGYLVNDFDCVPEGYVEEDIFWFGMSESAIKEAIDLKENTIHDFVITGYKENK